MKEHALALGFLCLAVAGNVGANKIEDGNLRNAVQGSIIALSLSVGTSLGARLANKYMKEALHRAFEEARRDR